MKDLKFPIIKDDFMPPQCKDMDEVLDFLNFFYDNNLIDKASVRLQKNWARYDRPFRIEPLKKAA